MTNEELEEFTDIMIYKLTSLPAWGDSKEDIFRQQVQQVIADTYLLVSGAVPLERWRESKEAHA